MGTDPVQWISDGTESLTSDPFLATGETYHLLFTYADENGSEDPTVDRIRLYVNGTLLSEAEGSQGYDVRKSGSFQIGAVASSLGINGVIDDFQIYQKELTADEVAFLYANPGEPLGGDDPPVVTPSGDFSVQSISRDGKLGQPDVGEFSRWRLYDSNECRLGHLAGRQGGSPCRWRRNDHVYGCP